MSFIDNILQILSLPPEERIFLAETFLMGNELKDPELAHLQFLKTLKTYGITERRERDLYIHTLMGDISNKRLL